MCHKHIIYAYYITVHGEPEFYHTVQVNEMLCPNRPVCLNDQRGYISIFSPNLHYSIFLLLYFLFYILAAVPYIHVTFIL